MRKSFRFGVQGVLPLLLSLLFLGAFTGCTGLVQEELEETHAKLKALQELVASANAELSALDKIVSLLDDKHTIDPVSLKETEDGYEVSFKDGKTIFIPYGKDGSDGRTLIPVGVMQAEDSLYYWTVDGEWLTDADGNKMRAGATDGSDAVDGIVPQVKVEDGFWWISVDGGENFEKIASCEEMNGVGVFSGIDTTDPSKLVLTLLDGTVLELPRQQSVKVSFKGQAIDTLLIGAGELLPIPYEVVVEGADSTSVVVTSGTDGTYFSRIVEGSQPGKGNVMVQAPAKFSEGYIILNAYCGGYSAVKMISFKERKVSTASETIRFKSEADTVKVTYQANFEYTLFTTDTTWLKVVYSPADTTMTFIATTNPADTVRTCTVTVTPKDNHSYTCTTFQVMQATDAVTTDFQADEGFSYNSKTWTLEAPAVGGNATIKITTGRDLNITSEYPDWFDADLKNDGGGFYVLKINVKANEGQDSRQDDITLMFGTASGSPSIPLTIQQAGKVSEPAGEQLP